MIAVPRLRDRLAPRAQEVLSIGERSRYLLGLRAAVALAPVVEVLVAPEEVALQTTTVIVGAALYLAICSIPEVLRRRSMKLPIVRGMLLLDGLFIAGAVLASGGAWSDLRFLALAHVVGVTLLFSYRSGLKIALWHTLLYLLVVYSQPLDPLGTGLTDTPTWATERTALITIAALWVGALATATFAALGDRELRRQKVDLERLSEMLAAIQAADGPDAIARVLLDELCSVFSFRRGVVLGAPEGDLAVLATTARAPGEAPHLAMEPLAYRARSERRILAVRRIDPETDPELASLLPDARNVLVIPLLVDRGMSVGLIAAERGGHEHGIRRWVLGMIEQYASHGALALNNAWLSEERRQRIEQIQELQAQLEAHNADLEHTVAERTAELRTAIARLEEADGQRRKLLHHVVRAGEAERQRIAGDIHDDPVQKLIALKMRLELLGKSHPELEEVAEAHDVVMVCIRSLRHLLFDLRPPILDEQGLAAALRSFLDNADVPFRWDVVDELRDEPSSQARVILYRIAQEVLTNARKHSHADRVEVRLSTSDGGTAMEIVDDGVGFEPREAVVAAPGHLGLAAIRERAEMAGGRCELHSLPGQGTTFDVWLPGSDGSDDVPRRTDLENLVDVAPRPDGMTVSGATR